MSIKKQTVVATFEVDVLVTKNAYGKSKNRVLLAPEYETDDIPEFEFQALAEQMIEAKLDSGYYRLEIKVISVE